MDDGTTDRRAGEATSIGDSADGGAAHQGLDKEQQQQQQQRGRSRSSGEGRGGGGGKDEVYDEESGGAVAGGGGGVRASRTLSPVAEEVRDVQLFLRAVECTAGGAMFEVPLRLKTAG